MAKNKLFYGGNLEVLRKNVADESVDLVYLDLPFNSNRADTTSSSNATTRCTKLPLLRLNVRNNRRGIFGRLPASSSSTVMRGINPTAKGLAVERATVGEAMSTRDSGDEWRL